MPYCAVIEATSGVPGGSITLANSENSKEVCVHICVCLCVCVHTYVHVCMRLCVHTVHAMKRFTFYGCTDACRLTRAPAVRFWSYPRTSVRIRSVRMPVRAPYVLTSTPVRR